MTPGERHLRFWTGRLTDPSCVYVIQGDLGTPIKVGYATDVEARIATLQTGNPQILRLLEVVPGDQRLEWNLHQRLRDARVLGEWFNGPMVEPFLKYMAALSWCMMHAYDGSGQPPRYTDFDTFQSSPERSPRAPSTEVAPTTPRARRGRAGAREPRRREPNAPMQPKPTAEPATATRELWTRIGQMWIGGATRSEIRGAEGLSREALEDVIHEMRTEGGYELAEGIELRRGPNETYRGPGKFRILGNGGRRRRPTVQT